MHPAQKYRSHFFTLRLWQEPLDPEQMESRFKVQHVLSGEVRYFRGWPLLIEYGCVPNELRRHLPGRFDQSFGNGDYLPGRLDDRRFPTRLGRTHRICAVICAERDERH